MRAKKITGPASYVTQKCWKLLLVKKERLLRHVNAFSLILLYVYPFVEIVYSMYRGPVLHKWLNIVGKDRSSSPWWWLHCGVMSVGKGLHTIRVLTNACFVHGVKMLKHHMYTESLFQMSHFLSICLSNVMGFFCFIVTVKCLCGSGSRGGLRLYFKKETFAYVSCILWMFVQQKHSLPILVEFGRVLNWKTTFQSKVLASVGYRCLAIHQQGNSISVCSSAIVPLQNSILSMTLKWPCFRNIQYSIQIYFFLVRLYCRLQIPHIFLAKKFYLFTLYWHKESLLSLSEKGITEALGTHGTGCSGL